MSHNEAAQARIEEVRAMRDKIPHFEIPDPKHSGSALVSAGTLPPEFVESAAATLKNGKGVARTDGASAEQIRDWMAYGDAYGPVADELEATAKFIRHSIAAARNNAGHEALTVYSIAQRLAKRRDTSELAPYVADMRRALAKRRKAKAQTAPQPAPRASAPQGTTNQ